jgi:hypothetical protein
MVLDSCKLSLTQFARCQSPSVAAAAGFVIAVVVVVIVVVVVVVVVRAPNITLLNLEDARDIPA